MPMPGRTEREHVRGDGEVRDVQERGEPAALEQDRHRLLRADDRDRDDRHARAHRDLDEAAAPEAVELVPVAEVLAGALRAFGEHERELLVVVHEPVRVVGVRGDAAGAGPQRAEHRQRAEQVLGEPVDRAAELGLDAVHDHRRVRRDRRRVVRDQQRATFAGDVLEPFPLGAEPVLVDRVVDLARERPEVLAAAPGVDVAPADALVLGLEVEPLRPGRGNEGEAGRVGVERVDVQRPRSRRAARARRSARAGHAFGFGRGRDPAVSRNWTSPSPGRSGTVRGNRVAGPIASRRGFRSGRAHRAGDEPAIGDEPGAHPDESRHHPE